MNKKITYYRFFFDCLEYNFERDTLLRTQHVIVSVNKDLDAACKMCKRINSNVRAIEKFEIVKDFYKLS